MLESSIEDVIAFGVRPGDKEDSVINTANKKAYENLHIETEFDEKPTNGSGIDEKREEDDAR